MRDFSFPDSILIDRGTQPRCEISDETVGEYKRAMLAGDKFPPMVVFDDGANYYLADGFHRYHAYVACEGSVPFPPPIKFIKGTHRDAQLYACGANHEHGLRRTNADKQKIVDFLLRDEEWGQWSDAAIARHAKVSDRMVAKWRSQLGRYARKNAKRRGEAEAIPESFGDAPETSRSVKVIRGGKSYEMKLKPKDSPDESGPPLDRLGLPINESRIQDVFDRDDAENAISVLRSVKQRLKNAESDLYYSHTNIAGIRKAIDDAVRMYRDGIPYTICPPGLPQRWTDIGFLSKSKYERLPEENRHA